MLRAVLDTNIIVSAALRPDGRQAQIVGLALSDAFRMCVSEPILEEYAGVLARPRFQLSEAAVASFLQSVRAHAALVHPRIRVRVASDPDDNMFLECAMEALAPVLVTGNLKHYPRQYREIRVVSPLEFQRVLAERIP